MGTHFTIRPDVTIPICDGSNKKKRSGRSYDPE